MKKKILLFVFLMFLSLIFIGSLFFFLFLKKSQAYYQPDSRVKQTSSYVIEDSKTVGWIQVQGTNIDYPVIMETPTAYESGIDYLWRPNSYEDKQNREVIYGHNILNVSSKPLINAEGHTRFEPLMGFVYENFTKENLYIQYTYGGEDHLYKIYAIGFYSLNEEDGTGITDENLVKHYIRETKKNSLYDFDAEVDSSDHLISLITCTRYFGLNGKTQFRIDAREVRKNEKIKKYSVYTNENYDIIK